jgi:hypothetical protein
MPLQARKKEGTLGRVGTEARAAWRLATNPSCWVGVLSALLACWLPAKAADGDILSTLLNFPLVPAAELLLSRCTNEREAQKESSCGPWVCKVSAAAEVKDCAGKLACDRECVLLCLCVFMLCVCVCVSVRRYVCFAPVRM